MKPQIFVNQSSRRLFLFIALLFLMSATRVVLAQTTSFTYQGRLSDGGAAANGTFDLQFKVFDNSAVGSGAQIGPTITNSTVQVANGVFTVPLDFGASAFPGADRFLEISVRHNNLESYTTLAPRQQLTSAPYAVRSSSASVADSATNATQLGGVEANQYVITNDSRLSDARTPMAGSANYIQNRNSTQAGSNFNIGGDGTVSGTLAGNVVNAATQYNLGGGRVLSVAGTNNTFAGLNSGTANSGGNNSFFGSATGFANTAEHDNTFIGAGAGSNNGVNDTSAFANFNTFVGSLAGSSNTTGGPNTFVGAAAGFSNTRAINNTFFGYHAGYANTDSCCNSFFGHLSGISTTGAFNSFFGQAAGFSNTTGTVNSFFGSNAGQFNTIGSNNSFFGVSAGLSNTEGNRNSLFGRSAGQDNTIGSDNSFFGYTAGLSNTEGSRNSSFGRNAGRFNTIGADNALFGYQAGLNNTADGNAFFGSTAGAANTTGAGNTFVGVNTGLSNTTENNNTFLGGNANGAAGITNATAIGANATVTSSNTIVLGDGNGSLIVDVTGQLQIDKLGAAGSQQLCLNSSSHVASCSSSLRYKTNLLPYLNGMNLINRLRPITFNWKEGGIRDVGFGAEEVARIEPLLVTYNKEGQVEGVKYDRLSAVFINAFKEQQAQIAEQQQQIEQERKELAKLQRELETLRQSVARRSTRTKAQRR